MYTNQNGSQRLRYKMMAIHQLMVLTGLSLFQVSLGQRITTRSPAEAQRDGDIWRQTLLSRIEWMRQGDQGSPNVDNGKQLATYMCPRDSINVAINPGIDKISKVAVLGAETQPGCSSYVMNNMYYLNINITNQRNPPCGIRRDVDGTMTVTVATQAYMNAYGGSDRMYRIQCKLGQKLTAQTTGTVLDGNLPAGMAFQQDSATVKLEIRDLTATRTLSQASLGEMVVLYAELINTAMYKGMDILNCMAYDNIEKNGAYMVLLENGCGTGDLLGEGTGFYHLPGFEDNVMVSTPIPMFRFLRSPFVMVECEFNKLCTMEDKAHCDQSCKKGGVARKRREVSRNSTVTTLLVLPESETQSSRLDLVSPKHCVDQMTIILAVVILGILVVLSTGAAIWFCIRWSHVKQATGSSNKGR